MVIKMTKQDNKPPEEDKIAEVIEKKQQAEKIEEAEAINKEEYDNLEVLANQHEANYKRALADYQNLQNRVNKEKQEWIKLSNKEMLLRLLPVLDTLLLASKHVDDQGLKVSVNIFQDTLKAEGVTKIKTVGEVFNPETMECIQTKEGEEGKVLEELRPGYMMHDKLLRPAQVTVGQESIKG